MSEIKIGEIVVYSVKNKKCYGIVQKLAKKYADITDIDDWTSRTRVDISKLKVVPPYMLTPEQVRQFVRFEKKWSVITANAEKNANIFFKEQYTITLNDMLTALYNIKQYDYDSETLLEEWVDHICDYFFNYDEILYCETTSDDIEVFDDLPKRDDKIIHVMNWLDDFSNGWADDIYSEIDDRITELENYIEDEKKPVEERRYTDDEKNRFIASMGNDDRLTKVSERELNIYRRFIDELCEKNVIKALECKGYGCYGGDNAYECDWETSLDCMLKLYELTGDAKYANTLGYIYYYGRCWDGEPQYEEAFKYFSIGAAGYYYESRYKLADMFFKGLYVKENKNIAESIVTELYNENIKYIRKGKFDCKFADIALRLGNYYKEKYSADSAYRCYLQAEFAIKRRLQYDYYGDKSVAGNIRQALDDITEKMPKRKKTSRVYPWYFLDGYLKDYRKLQMKIKPLKNGNAKITVRIVPFKDEKYPPKMFITETGTGFCGMLERVSLTVKRAEIKNCADGTVYFDKIDGYEFYLGDKLVAEIEGEYYFSIPKKQVEQKYKFASVYFENGGKRYDYILDIDGVNVNDEVIVITDRGETVVTVADISEKNESELALPLNKYKKVVSKK